MSPASELDIRTAISAAIEDVDALGLQGADRAVTLGVALAKRLGFGIVSASPALAPRSHDVTPTGDDEKKEETKIDGLVSKIAKATKLSMDVLEQVYDDRDGDLAYVISPRKLAGNNAEATRQLARIVALGRQTAGLEEWTATSVIREVVSEYGKFDSANFASHITALDKFDTVQFKGKGTNRSLKLTRSAVESMSEKLQALVSA